MDFGFTKTRPIELGYGKKRSMVARAAAAVSGAVSSVAKTMGRGGAADSSETRTSNGGRVVHHVNQVIRVQPSPGGKGGGGGGAGAAFGAGGGPSVGRTVVSPKKK